MHRNHAGQDAPVNTELYVKNVQIIFYYSKMNKLQNSCQALRKIDFTWWYFGYLSGNLLCVQLSSEYREFIEVFVLS